MAIIGSDYDGTTQYTFSGHGSNVVLKQGVLYNYYGNGAALSMDVYYAHLLVSGQIYSANHGISYNSYGAYIDIAATGMVVGGSGAGIQFVSESAGAVTINNFGVIEGQSGIDAGGATGYVYVFNSGIIQSDREYNYAIYLGDANDRLVNTGSIIGGVFAGDGDDYLDSHLGTLIGTLNGGAGNDTYIIAAGQTVDEGTTYYDQGGYDTVQSYGDFTLPDNVESLTLLGSATIGRGNDGSNTIVGNDNGNRLFGGAGIDGVQAGSGDDVLRGGAGNDQLISTEGSDRFFGDGGDDVLVVGLDKVTLDGGAGIDVAAFLYNDTAIVADFTRANIVTGGAAAADVLKNIEGVWGSEFNDTLTGNDGANNLLGYLGDDTIKGGGGDDVIEGYTGADTMDGGDGIDTLSYANSYSGSVTVSLLTNTGSGEAAGDTFINFENVRGGQSDDTLTGSTGANVLEGGSGNDTLNGGNGADTLYGDSGNDTLTGGAAKDVFGFRDFGGTFAPSSPGGFGQDTITDFQDGLDRISLVGDSQVHSLTDLTISQVGTSTVIGVTGTTDQITLLNFNAVNFTSADVIFGA